MSALDFSKIKKIAIVRRNGFGDLLCAYPLILFLKKKAPDAKITLFLDERNVSLLPFLPKVDRVAIFPKRGNKYWNIVKMALPYFREFDLAISAKTAPMKLMNFFLFFLKAKIRIAYVDNKWHSKCITHPLSYDKLIAKQKHQAIKGLELINAKWSHDLFPTLTIPLEIKDKYREIEDKLQSLKQEGPLFLITASVNRDSSRLEARKYSQLLNELHKKHPISVVVIGEKKDRARAEEISSLLEMPFLLHLPQNFEEFMVMLSLATHVFLGDGGVGHLASSLQKKGVILYGDTSPTEWGPLSKEMIILHDAHNINEIDESKVLSALILSLCPTH